MHIFQLSESERHKSGFQARAREWRQSCYQGLVHEKTNPCFIATAHHADDQLETYFHKLLRGVGLPHLQPVSGDKISLIFLRFAHCLHSIFALYSGYIRMSLFHISSPIILYGWTTFPITAEIILGTKFVLMCCPICQRLLEGMRRCLGTYKCISGLNLSGG